LDPIFFGDYPASMRAAVGSNLPTFTPNEAALIKGSQDFVGINHYSSMYATYNDTNGEIIKTGILIIFSMENFFQVCHC
jgi:beta-glucosidase